MDESPPRKEEEGGGAGWIMTFADLMSLLMCFFVLLLSFAELDIMKFKAIAGSMKLAFGVQRDIKAIEVPKGTSLVAQEFSAGKPDPTVINEVRQKTMDEDKQSLEFTDALVNDIDGTSPEERRNGDSGEADRRHQAELDAARLAEALQTEIDQGMIQIETEGAAIIIRIREKGSFPSGSASFDPAFEAVIDKMRASLDDLDGTIAVAGHTDNIPIRTRLYRSNWDLSSARAVTVVHALLESSELDPARFVVEGHGDAHPLMPNDSAENRALNRRVEITIRQQPPEAPPGGAVAGTSPDMPEMPGLPGVPDIPDIPAIPEIPAVPDFPAANGAPQTIAVLDDTAADEPGTDPGVSAASVAEPRSDPGTAPASVPGPEDPATPSLPIPASAGFPSAAAAGARDSRAVFPDRPANRPPSRLEAIRGGIRGTQ